MKGNSEALISVIVPIYKIEAYITECIESILNQTYRDLEVILVDDGSPDKCGGICDLFAQKDSRVVVLHKENGGLSDARNHGILRATGDVLSFVDGDDVLDLHCFEKMMEQMQKNDADIVECKYLSFEDGTTPKADGSDPAAEIQVRTPAEWIMETGRRDYESCVAWGKLYRRAIFEDVRFPLGRLHEDEATTYKAVYRANKVVRMEEKLYFYRQRAGSITDGKKNLRSLTDTVLAFEERYKFFAENGEKDIAAFTYAQYGLVLIGQLKRKYELTGEWRDWQKKIRTVSKSVWKARAVPLRYRGYLALMAYTPLLKRKATK